MKTPRIPCLLAILFAGSLLAQTYPLKVCSFNIQWVGNSASRDNDALAALVAPYEIVVVQEVIAPPYAGHFPDGKPFKPNPKTQQFFDAMRVQGFQFVLSAEDTGPGAKNHNNSSSTEWFVTFYRTNAVLPAADLPSGFLASKLAHNPDYDRVPFAFPFRTLDAKLDFVLISVHLRPNPGLLNKNRRQHELQTIASWIATNHAAEKDYIILGDMNIEGPSELAFDTPANFQSLNRNSRATNTNIKKPKPFDHVMLMPAYTQGEIDQAIGFQVINLIEAMRPVWKAKSTKRYPGDAPYNHNLFRKYYSDHNPVVFALTPLPSGDDD